MLGYSSNCLSKQQARFAVARKYIRAEVQPILAKLATKGQQALVAANANRYTRVT